MEVLDRTIIPRFYEAYKNDSEMATVDAFIGFHVVAMCEVFATFNKSLLVIPTIRYELYRWGRTRWNLWNEELKRIAANSRNIVGANNLYDVKYIQYFTGIRPHWVPSYCGYVGNNTYKPTRPGFILTTVHVYSQSFHNLIMAEYPKGCKRINCSVELIPLRHRYSHYQYSDLTAHQGIVHVPYQVSVMSLFEQYRMAIPLFFPTREALAKWHIDYKVSVGHPSASVTMFQIHT